jgi:hypothetical protein
MRATRGLAIALAVSLGARAAVGVEPVDLLFDTAHLRNVEIGETLSYAHRLTSPRSSATTRLLLIKRDDDASSLVFDADGAARETAFDGLSGNPVLMFMLEQAVRITAQNTGGSPHYLRNRMRGALRSGLARSDGGLVMRPFADDPNRARLGPFADLTLAFEIDAATPGMLRRLSARTPDGLYAEEIVLDP